MRQGVFPAFFMNGKLEGDKYMDLKTVIKEADMVLVGIGEDLEETFEQLENVNEEPTELLKDLKKRNFLKSDNNTSYDKLYTALQILLEGKNYFIVTLSRDDKIYNSGLNKERIVAPLGSYDKLQCVDVCTSDIYAFSDFEEIIKADGIAYCPHCGKNLVTNRIGVPRYSEEGYLPMWNMYMKWLQGTLNKKLCVLELGVGLNYPTVIRWPFEKMCYINQKSTLIRVNEHLSQLTETTSHADNGMGGGANSNPFHESLTFIEKLGERGIYINEKPLGFLRNEIV